MKSPSSTKCALREVLRLYTRYFPLDKGKGRLVRLMHPVLSEPGEIVCMTAPPGIRLELDLDEFVQRGIYYYGCHEPAVTPFFLSCLREGMIVVDAGAHVGWYTLLAARGVGPSGQVHAFEPETRNFRRLARNVELNSFSNVWLNQSALADFDGQAVLHVQTGDDNSGVNSLRVTSPTSQHGVETCDTVRLDTYFAQHGGRIDVMKLDVEGAELLVLRGGARVVADSRPLIVMEAEDRNARAFGHSTSRLKGFLAPLGYYFYVLTGHGMRPVSAGSEHVYDTLICIAKP